MSSVKLIGNASGREFILALEKRDSKLSLLEYLCHKEIPIAYSCYGEGIRNKCLVRINSKEQLSCQIFMKNLSDGDIIEISYL